MTASAAVEAQTEPVTRDEADGSPERSGPSASFVRLGRVTAAVVLIGAVLLGHHSWQGSKRVDLEDAAVRAPQVVLPTHGGGTLKQVYATVGDEVAAHRPIARVGSEVITSTSPVRSSRCARTSGRRSTPAPRWPR